MKSRKYTKAFIGYIALLLAIMISFLCMYIYCKIKSAQPQTYTFEKGNFIMSKNGLTLMFRVNQQKIWNDEQLHAGIPTGAQYDGVLKNTSGHLYKDWEASFEFTDELLIDSSWNGIFATGRGNKSILSFKATGETASVKDNTDATFGSILYSKDVLILKKCTLTGFLIYKITDLLLFKILLVVLSVESLAILITLILAYQSKLFNKKQELDKRIINQTMETFTGFIDAKDPYTNGHSIRVAEYSREIAIRMKLSDSFIDSLYYIALMHDCGKIGVPDEILKKPSKLTDEEYKRIQTHTSIGNSILKNFNAIPNLRDGAHYHHERYDGKGYPEGLEGEAIPLCARIICVADSYDAMSSSRSYRKQLSDESVLKELEENEGKQFDPNIVPVIISMIKDGFTKTIQNKKITLS